MIWEVDEMLVYDLKAGFIVEELKCNFPNASTPTATQIYRKLCEDSWEVSKAVRRWVAAHLTSKEAYDQIEDLRRPIVLDEFGAVLVCTARRRWCKTMKLFVLLKAY